MTTKKTIDFKIGDEVWWWDPYSPGRSFGIIEEIDEDLDLMFIWLPKYKINNNCHGSMSAIRKSGEWFAYKGYVGYTQKVYLLE